MKNQDPRCGNLCSPMPDHEPRKTRVGIFASCDITSTVAEEDVVIGGVKLQSARGNVHITPSKMTRKSVT